MTKIIIDNPSPETAMQVMSFQEGLKAEKRKARRKVWSKVLEALTFILCGAGISTVLILATIGLFVVL
jgi:hypothetical protein